MLESTDGMFEAVGVRDADPGAMGVADETSVRRGIRGLASVCLVAGGLFIASAQAGALAAAAAASAASATTTTATTTVAATAAAFVARPTRAGGDYVFFDRSLTQRRCERFGVDGEQLLIWFSGESDEGNSVNGREPGSNSGSSSDPGSDSRSGSGSGSGPERIPLAQCLAVLRDASAADGGTPVLLQSDGQRFPGEPEVRDAHGVRKFLWRHRRFGQLQPALEAIRAIVFTPGAVVPTAEANDVVVLANGDRIEGLVSELGATIAIERAPSGTAASVAATGSSTTSGPGEASGAPAGSMTDVPLARVAAIAFITPPEPARGQAVWCTDGTIVAAAPNIDVSTGLIQLRRASDRGAQRSGDAAEVADAATVVPVLPPAEIIGYVPDRSAIAPLAALPPFETRGTGDMPRREISPPETAVGIWPADAPPIRFQGPAIFRFRLPATGCSLVGTIAAFQADEAWTDFDVILRDGDRELLRGHISAESEPLVVALQLSSDELSIEVTEGEHGPVRDVAEFRQALLVLPRGTPPAAAR